MAPFSSNEGTKSETRFPGFDSLKISLDITTQDLNTISAPDHEYLLHDDRALGLAAHTDEIYAHKLHERPIVDKSGFATNKVTDSLREQPDSAYSRSEEDFGSETKAIMTPTSSDSSSGKMDILLPVGSSNWKVRDKITIRDWEGCRPIFERLYVDKGKKLDEVMRIMNDEYGFSAT